MEEIDKRISELFIVPPSLGRTMSMRSQRSEMKEDGLQRRLSIKNRILGVFQSSKNSKEPSPESTRSLRRKSHQQVERLSTWAGGENLQSKEKAVDRTKSNATTSGRSPPVSMDRYPMLRTMTSPDLSSHQPTLPPPNAQSSKSSASLATSQKSRNLPTSPRQISLQPATRPRKTSTSSTRTFSFTRRLSLRAEDKLDTPTPRIEPITIHPPVSLASQLFSTILDNPSKHSKHNSTSTTGRDSKFSSSVSSLPSLKSLESTPRTSAVLSPVLNMSKPISDHDFAQLESIVRRVERRLNQQYEQCQQLSANLVRLSGRKIYSLTKSEALVKSVNMPKKPEIMAMKSLINNTKEKVRIMFLKKSAVVQRSTFALVAVKDAISNTKNDHPEGAYIIDIEPFLKLCSVVKDDLAAQRKLDGEMKVLLGSLRKNPNFQINLRDKFEMGQFEPFVDGRLGMMEANYCRLEALCERIGTVGV